MSTNRLKNIAVVGAAGRSGSYMVSSLLAAGKHRVTAITRSGSSSTFPSAVSVAKVDYDDPATLVTALRGQDVLIITMAVTAPPGQEKKLIAAAVDAKVRWVLPNEWGYEYSDAAGRDVFLGPAKKEIREHIESVGLQWIGAACGFWYEFSLAGGVERFGFDIGKREVTLFDDGRRQLSTSTWKRVGEAVAALLALPESNERGEDGPAVEDWRNRFAHFASFTVSQRDMWESLQRVTGTTEKDWKVTKVPVEDIYKQGTEQFAQGDMRGFAKALYSRMFFEDDAGNAKKLFELDDEKLGLSAEDLDEATRRAVELSEDGGAV